MVLYFYCCQNSKAERKTFHIDGSHSLVQRDHTGEAIIYLNVQEIWRTPIACPGDSPVGATGVIHPVLSRRMKTEVV